ncbi:MAG: recombinase family protein [Eubacteriales bacterium]
MNWLEENFKIAKHTSVGGDIGEEEVLFKTDKPEIDEDGNYLVSVAYTRVSTEKQAEEGFGLATQKEHIINYCREKNIKNCILFTDAGKTGTTMERIELNRIKKMITDFNENRTRLRIKAFIVPRIDRLARTIIGTFTFIEDYLIDSAETKQSTINKNKRKIDFISVAEPDVSISGDNYTSKLMFSIFASFAEFDRNQICTKLKEGRIARVKQGRALGGGNQPYAYRYDKNIGGLVVDEEKKERLLNAARLYTEEHISPGKIAQILGFKSERSVAQALKSPANIGLISYRGEEYQGIHEPIFSPELYEAILNESESRRVVRGRSTYLLTGLLFCGECGAKMRYQKWGKRVKICCYSRQLSRPDLVKDPNCPSETYDCEDVEDAVIGKLFEMNYLADENIKKERLTVSVTEATENEMAKERKRLETLYDLYSDSPETTLKNKIDAKVSRIKELEKILEDEKKRQTTEAKISRAINILRDLKSAWGHMSDSEKQAVCRELINKVVIYKDAKIEVFFKLGKYLGKEG